MQAVNIHLMGLYMTNAVFVDFKPKAGLDQHAFLYQRWTDQSPQFHQKTLDHVCCACSTQPRLISLSICTDLPSFADTMLNLLDV